MAEERVQRRLAAILAADVVGFSRMMEADEAGTLATLKARRKDVLEPLVAKHQGRVFKVTGDGVLVEFASAVNAVQCAVELQQAFATANGDLPEERQIVLRIGVNLGDVMAEGGDLYGDGVNIAARLEVLAEPGGILVSEDAHRQVRNKLHIGFDELGPQPLKNIAEPVRAYRVTGTPVIAVAALKPITDRPSIAVLPFENLSGESAQEYFADGVVEEIITALSRFHWLFVIARNSSFTYKGRAVDVKRVGRELGVRYVLEGSLRKAGNRVRITGQLIDTSTGVHLWADKFDGSLEDIFDLQEQLTANVVGAIAPKLEQAEIARAKRKPTESLDAYDYYLRGLAGVYRWSRQGNDEGLLHFRRAIELDPEFAAAYGRAANCYVWRTANGWISDRAREIAYAGELARRAVELGKDDPTALCTGGIVLAYVVHEVEEGAAYIDRALALNPNGADAWGFSSWARVWLGQPELAIEHAARAMRLSPFDPYAYNLFAATALAYLLLGRYDESCLWAERAMREVPTYASAFRSYAAASALVGRMEEAHKAVERLHQLNPGFRISDARDLWPFRRPQDFNRYADGLRKAGLPE
jgi:TolB-like protein